MKVIAYYKDGGTCEVEVRDSISAKEAIDRARKEVDEPEMVDRWEVEEDFI